MLSRLRSVVQLLLRPAPDVSTEAGRSQDRYRRAGHTALAAVVARVVNIATGLATVPLALAYLGPDRFGLWMTLTSLVAFMTFTDLGLGIGLQNALTQCHASGDRERPKSFVSSALCLMTLSFIVLVLVAVFVLPLVPFDRIIKTETEAARRELLPTVQVMVIAFGFGLPAGLMLPIYTSQQRGYWANLWLTAGRVVGSAGVLVGIVLKVGLPVLAAAMMVLPFVTLAVGGIVLFAGHPYLRPSVRAIRLGTMRAIMGTGVYAMLSQLAFMVIQGIPALIIANRLSTAAVTPFTVTQKLLTVPGILLNTAVMPLWPAYGEAAARGDYGWVKRTFRRSIVLWLVVYVPFCAVMAFLGQWIIRLWTGNPAAVPGGWLFAGCLVWTFIFAWNVVASVLLNGLNRFLGTAAYGLFFAALGAAVAYGVAPRYGATGVVWAIVIASVVTRALAMLAESVYALRKRAFVRMGGVAAWDETR